MSTKNPQIASKNRLEKLNGEKTEVTKKLTITAPDLRIANFKVVGKTPYVQNKFSAKAREQMKANMEAGSTAKKGKTRPPKDFKQCYEDAQYRPLKGVWPLGAIPATQFKAAMVSACRLVDFKMTEAKQCVYILPDGYDIDRTPLVKITKGEPIYFEQAVRNDNGGADIRPRPMWEEGWEAIVRIQYDAARFTLEDVANLLLRAGCQVGIGEGRMASRMCVGLGWGAFEIAEK